jgi:hypothetical protein
MCPKKMEGIHSQASVSTGLAAELAGPGWSLVPDLEAPLAFFNLEAWVVRLLLVGRFPTPPLAIAAP